MNRTAGSAACGQRDPGLKLFPGTRRIDLPARQQPCGDTIALLWELLEKAEHGEIVGVAAAWLRSDGRTSSHWAGGRHFWSSSVAGAVVVLLVDYVTAVLRATR